MPYAKELLVYLNKKGYKLAIASNRPAKFSDILLRYLKIKIFFDYVLCKDQIKFGKPHPSILNKIMQKLKISPKQTLYVGDMAIDVRTGKRAKTKTFAVRTGSSSYSELKKERPDFLSKDLSFFGEKTFKTPFDLSEEVGKLINGLIKSSSTKRV